ncbi:MAG TPA: gliding motility lipoprotein GldH [Flavisolibacter sp.]|nr:gliding motility lipoprotein GldH [Flavisolibacter sp.]
MFRSKGITGLSLWLLLAGSIALGSCEKINLYEKNASIPGHSWKSSFKPSFRFAIEDTTVPYEIFIVLRHNERYNYNNIWLSLTVKDPSGLVQRSQLELPLANNEGWIGKETAMDDLYEHRILITPKNLGYLKKGEYVFTVGHIMREDPLENVLNIGVRVEKRAENR